MGVASSNHIQTLEAALVQWLDSFRIQTFNVLLWDVNVHSGWWHNICSFDKFIHYTNQVHNLQTFGLYFMIWFMGSRVIYIEHIFPFLQDGWYMSTHFVRAICSGRSSLKLIRRHLLFHGYCCRSKMTRRQLMYQVQVLNIRHTLSLLFLS